MTSTHEGFAGHPTDGAVQEAINTYWSRHAAAYDDFQVRQLNNGEIRAAWLAVWQAALPPPPARVLDLGTGSGNVALLLASAGYEVVGIDLAEGMLEVARGKAGDQPDAPTFVCDDAVAPRFEPASFDAVVGRYVLWTTRQPDVALRNWRALLRPVGRLALVDSTWFPDGIRGSSPETLTARQADFVASYRESVLASLPLAQARTIEPSVELVRSSGFTDVVARPLYDILELDRTYGVAEGHEVRLQYLVTGAPR